MAKCEPNEKGNEKGGARIKKVSHKPQYVYIVQQTINNTKSVARETNGSILDAIHNIEESKHAKAPAAAAAALSFAPVHGKARL